VTGCDKGRDRLAIDHHHSPPSVDRSVVTAGARGEQGGSQRCVNHSPRCNIAELRWGNLPDPRPTIKARGPQVAQYTSFTRLLGSKSTLILAIQPRDSPTATTLAPNARCLTSPSSAQRLQPAFYYALCTPWGSARRRGPSFPQNVWPAFDPMRESTSVLTALDPLFFNCEILSVLIQRLPAFTFNPQVPGTSPPAAQNSRGRCSTSLSYFCRNELSFLFNEYSPTRVIWPGNHQSPASAHAEQREKLPVPLIALTRPRVADRSELRATPDPPRVSITRRAIQAAQRSQTSFPAISGPPVLLCATAVPRFSELNRVLSQPLQTPVRGVLHPSRPFGKPHTFFVHNPPN
ncbi:hypothetical protein B0H16DRAFT_1487421, partial [Mycena metata]